MPYLVRHASIDPDIQEHPLTLGLPTAQAHVSVLMASDKVLAVSISSMFSYTGGSLLRQWQGSRKIRFSGGYNVPLDANPFNSWATVLDCGDIPVTSYVSTLPKIPQHMNGH